MLGTRGLCHTIDWRPDGFLMPRLGLPCRVPRLAAQCMLLLTRVPVLPCTGDHELHCQSLKPTEQRQAA